MSLRLFGLAEQRAIVAERDALLVDVERLTRERDAARAGTEIAIEFGEGLLASTLERVERLRAVARATESRSISIIANMCHGLGCGACLECTLRALQPGDLGEEQPAPALDASDNHGS